MATLNNQPWYCNGSFLSGWLGCDDYLPTAQDQVQMMSDNFGKGIDQGLKDQSLTSYQDWLTTSGYDETMAQLKAKDSMFGGISWTGLLIGVGVVGLVSMLSNGPRRYGR